MSNEIRYLYEFDDFCVDPQERVLFKQNNPLRLPPKTFDLLLVLVERSGQTIEKNELMKKVWADAFVEDANLTVHISALRKILGNGANGDKYIETIPKRGYRFGGNVRKIPVKSGELVSFVNANPLNFEEIPSFQSNNLSDEDLVKQNLHPEPFITTPRAGNLPQRNQPYKKGLIIFVPIVILIVVLVSALAVYKQFNSRSSFQEMKITRILDTGKTVDASVSPDGKFIVHIVADGGQASVWVKHIATNSSVQLIPPAAVNYNGLTVSNDGNYTYYAAKPKDQSKWALYRIPVLGGEQKKILEDVGGTISFSPDGERFAFVRNVAQDETALIIANINGGGERRLVSRGRPEYFSPSGLAWSPDGKVIACVAGIASGERFTNISIISVEDGTEKTLSNRKWRNIERVAWTADGSGLITTAMEAIGQEISQLWFFPFPTGEARRITNDLNDYGGVSLTADSKTLVTTQFEDRRSIWIVPNGETDKAKLVADSTPDVFRFVAWTPDKKIIYPSLASGSRDIWIMNADGNNRKQLTATSHNDILPVATPYGRYIVFASNRAASGAVNIWRMNIDGTNVVQLTKGSDESQPNCTPDGKWVIYVSGGNDGKPEQRTIWKVPIEGGESIQLTTNPAYGAHVSPDGKQIVSWYKEDKSASWKAALIPIEGGRPVKLFDIAPASPLRWTPDGNAITYIKTQNAASNIWSQPLNGEPPKQLTGFTAEQIYFFDWSSNNDLVCSRGTSTRNAILISDFR